jgi:hypothetical protein
MAVAEGTSVLHVHPVGDLIEHEISEDCLCGPRVQPVVREDGSIGWLIVHHSLDGREIREREEAARGDLD